MKLLCEVTKYLPTKTVPTKKNYNENYFNKF